MADRPLLALRSPTKSVPESGNSPRESVLGVGAGRQNARLGPKFDRLEQVLPDPARLAQLRDDPAAIVPERALVFEITGSLTDFYRAARAIGLQFLGEDEGEILADGDFAVANKPDKLVPVRLYFTIPDVQALRELVSLWRRFQQGQPLGKGRAAWKSVFEHLKDVRPWGPRDRLTDDAVADWREQLATVGMEPISFEVEFWFRDQQERRQATEDSFRAVLGGLGGQIIHQATIEPIRYHAALVQLPRNVIQGILDHPDVGLVTVDDVMVLRPQAIVGDVREIETENAAPAAATPPQGALLPPVAALFDGLPMAGHDLLRGWLEVDDPEDFAASYGAASEQNHGTTMASLIIHGDLDAPHDPIKHRLYVRPVTQPRDVGFGERRELMPGDRLGLDLMWTAFQRMLAGDAGAAPTAPTVRVVNISLGDAKRRFYRVMSPWAKLIDYIAWTYKTLVLVSAGNILDPVRLPATIATWGAFENTPAADREKIILESILGNRATRRLLAPAESVNALTVGACFDEGLATTQTGVMAVGAYATTSLPNPSSALGHGYQRAIKPELLFPGGREHIRANTTHAPIDVRPVSAHARYFGVRAACAGALGLTSETTRNSGTSVATALGTHDAIRIIESLETLPRDVAHPVLDVRFTGVIVKALLVHAARWDSTAADVLKAIINPQKNMHWIHERDELTRILGYGRPDIARVLDCAEKRASMVGWGLIKADEADQYRIPLPPSLQGIPGFRSVTITVAWLTPFNLDHRMYRMAKLNAFASSDKKFSLGVDPGKTQPSHFAVDRGTIFHSCWEGDRASPFVDNGDLVFNVGCKATAGDLDTEIPYAVAVTIEVGDDVAVPVYEEIRTRLRAPVRVRA